MKTKFYLSIIAIFLSIHLFAQVKAVKPMASKAVETAPTSQTLTKPEVAKPQNKPAPTPTDLQKAIVNIVSGDDGKDDNTVVQVDIYDGNQRQAAHAIDDAKEYLPGENQTLNAGIKASEYTGQMDNSKYPPLPVLRQANLSDFANGGSIDILIVPTGNDTWKISSFSLTLFFNNDAGSPHKMTWTGFTLTQSNQAKHLEFDKNFNPIQ
jgi:hypothetical protein